MATKLTDRQKEQFYRKSRNLNFQSSSALDGVTIEPVDLKEDKPVLSADQLLARIEEVRGRYEQ